MREPRAAVGLTTAIGNAGELASVNDASGIRRVAPNYAVDRGPATRFPDFPHNSLRRAPECALQRDEPGGTW